MGGWTGPFLITNNLGEARAIFDSAEAKALLKVGTQVGTK
jgi:hypothetical protein